MKFRLNMKTQLDKEEKDLLDRPDKGEWKSVSKFEKKKKGKLKDAASNTFSSNKL